MKKLVLLTSLFLIWGSLAYAQCVNDTLLIVETVCHDECVEINNTDFCVDGFYIVQVANGCDTTLYILDLTVLPRLETYLDEVVCAGECLDYNGTELCQSGSYEFEFITSLGCDSTVTLNLEVLQDSPQITIGNTGPLNCINNPVFLLASSSIPNSSYFWEGPGIDSNNENEQYPQVALPGIYTVYVTSPQGCASIESVEVFGYLDGPEVSISGNDLINCNNLSNTIIASTNEPNVTYEWIGPNGFSSNSNEIQVSEMGEYVLTVETEIGCSTTEIVEVVENDEPLFVDAGPNTHIQCNFVMVLEAPGAAGDNLIYEWTTNDGSMIGGINTLSLSINASGTYTLTVYDLDTGCSGSDDVIVYNSLAVITEDFLVLDCNNSILQIDASESYDGVDAYIQWTTVTGNIVDGENTLTPTIDAPGTYQLVIIRPGCISFAIAVVIEDIDVPDITIDSDGSTITCNSNLELTAVSNTPNLNYLWYLDGNLISEEEMITATEAGLYEVFVSGTNGCTNSASIDVTTDLEPQAIILYGDTHLDCNLNGVGTLNVFASGPFDQYLFNWTTQGGTILSNSNTQSISILGAGTYCIEITNPLNGCTLIDCEEITAISPIDLNITSMDASCNNSNDGFIEVEVEGGTLPYVYEWSNGATTSGIYDLTPGTYLVTVTDANDCFDYGTVEIGVSSNSLIVANAGDDGFFDCLTNLLVLNGGNSDYPNDATFEWTTLDGEIIDGANTLFPTVGMPGTYLLTITDIFGCDDTDEVVVFETIANAGPGQVIDCNNSSVQLDGSQSQNGATYLWTTDDGNIVDGETTLNPTVNEIGTYTLTVTSQNGCTASSAAEVAGDFSQPDLSANNIQQPSCVDPVQLNANSNDPGTIFEWFDDQNQSLGMDAEVLEPGAYTVVAAGVNGCTSETTISVTDNRAYPEGAYPSIQYLNCFNGNPLLLDFDIVSPDNVDVQWTTANGNIVANQGSSILVDQAGNYDVLMTETNGGCESNASIEVVEGGVAITSSSTNTSCGMDDGTASVSTTGINNPVYEWSNGATTSSVSGLAPGIYSVTISSTNGSCEEVRSFEILQDPSCLAVISGYVYNDDATLSCDPDGDVIGQVDVTVHLLPDDVYTSTDVNGYYEFLVPSGDYTVKALPVSPYVVICPDNEEINITIDPGDPESTDNNFFLDILSNFDLYGYGSSSAAAPGQNQYYQITYCNNGFQTIDGTLVFTHDPLLTGFDPDASGATSYDPATYTATWEFEDLSFFECEFINFTLFVPENVPDGTVLQSLMVVQPTLGDISPSNNTYSWTKTVHDPSPNSITGNDDDDDGVVESFESDLSKGGETFKLLQNQPNPFKNLTIIPFYLNNDEPARLIILDMNGRLIKEYDGFSQGYNEVKVGDEELDGNGIYYYQLVTKNTTATEKMVLIK
jgi:hypothetical protein